MTIEKIFSKDYLFNANTPVQSKLYIPLIILFGLMLIFSVLVKLIERKQKNLKLANIFFGPFFWGSLVGFLNLFARYETLGILGSRFVLAFVLFGSFIWLMIGLILAIRALPGQVKKQKTEEKYQKYLPKKKG